MSVPMAGTLVGLEIPAKDVARCSAFYSTVFGWKFTPSTLGLPEDKFLSFETPGSVFPLGGAVRRVEPGELAAVKGTIKLYLFVDDMTTAIEAIENNGGKKVSDVIPEGKKGLYQFFQDSEGNGAAIYTYQK